MWNAADVKMGLKKTDDRNWTKSSSTERGEMDSL